MKPINTRYLSNFTPSILALSIFFFTSANSAFNHSAMATGPATLTSPAAAPANLVGSQHINPTVNAQNRMPTETTSAPTAQPATVQGINTAGTVRVNNFTWVEPTVNFTATTGEVCGLLFGAYLIFTAFANNLPTKSKRVRRALLGISIMLLGVVLPGTANWFVAGSCGDVVLFN